MFPLNIICNIYSNIGNIIDVYISSKKIIYNIILVRGIIILDSYSNFQNRMFYKRKGPEGSCRDHIIYLYDNSQYVRGGEGRKGETDINSLVFNLSRQNLISQTNQDKYILKKVSIYKHMYLIRSFL